MIPIDLEGLSRAYLACPYSHPDHEMREMRVTLADKVAGELMLMGFQVFSPLTHSHRVAKHIADKVCACDHEFWLTQDKPFFEACDIMFILTLAGWRESKGIKTEMEWANKYEMPIVLVHIDDNLNIVGMERHEY